jgi:hypothetical protein
MYLAIDLGNAIQMRARHLDGAQLTSSDLCSKIKSSLPNDLVTDGLA